MSGSNTVPCGYDLQYASNMCTSPPQVLGALGVPAVSNTPSGGIPAANWIDKQGNLWLFGSSNNLDVTGQYIGSSSDLWVYSPSLNQWAWMGGDSATSNCGVPQVPLPDGPYYQCQGSAGVVGPEYQPSIGNLPKSRTGAVGWSDSQGNFLLFSGEVIASNNLPEVFASGFMNDLWFLQPSATDLPPASTPVFSLYPGSYVRSGSLTISNGIPNAKIYYTTDGTTPGSGSSLYTTPLTVLGSEMVRAIAVAPGYINSAVATATYSFPAAPPPPVFSLAPGTYSGSQTLTLSDSAPNAIIYYTNNGTNPFPFTAATTEYTVPIAVSSSQTITAAALDFENTVITGGITGIRTGTVEGNSASATYTINLPQTAAPTFSPGAGTYTSTQIVSISDSTSGAAIYYTTDGTAPTANSTKYTRPISISKTETIQAIATATGYSQSAVASAAFVINLPLPSFTITGTAVTVTAGATSGNTSTITLTPSGGFTGTVSLTCAITPTTVSNPPTCIIPASVTISGASAQTATLTVSTTAPASALSPAREILWPSVGGAALACLMLFGIPAQRRRWQNILGVLVLLLLITCGVLACGGGSGGGGGGSGAGNPGTTRWTYSITVSGTSGAIAQTGAVSLTVQ